MNILNRTAVSDVLKIALQGNCCKIPRARDVNPTLKFRKCIEKLSKSS